MLKGIKIIVTKRGRKVGQWKFNGRRVVIGRGRASDLSLPRPSVSRAHAVVELAPDGDVWITDNQSRYGFRVNGTKISRSILSPRDEVNIEGFKLRCESLDAEDVPTERHNPRFDVVGGAEVETPGPAGPSIARAPADAPSVPPPMPAKPAVKLEAEELLEVLHHRGGEEETQYIEPGNKYDAMVGENAVTIARVSSSGAVTVYMPPDSNGSIWGFTEPAQSFAGGRSGRARELKNGQVLHITLGSHSWTLRVLRNRDKAVA